MTNDVNDKDRPFLVIISLKYKGKRRPFAIPFRSNIQVRKSTEGTYFPLPRRKTTKEKHAHGLHIIKIFPIDKKYYNKFVMKKDDYNDLLLDYIDRNIKNIIDQAQKYLEYYENGTRYNFCTDIDRLIKSIEDYEKTALEADVAATILHENEEIVYEGLLRSEMVPDTLARVPEMMDTPPIR